ncbi:MAG: hypothetical protein HC888_06625 [Candidatus Competibacteraceae bacterium]|nr:hypothetical protein [Candidatus Competibacteraceae bacterium]
MDRHPFYSPALYDRNRRSPSRTITTAMALCEDKEHPEGLFIPSDYSRGQAMENVRRSWAAGLPHIRQENRALVSAVWRR